MDQCTGHFFTCALTVSPGGPMFPGGPCSPFSPCVKYKAHTAIPNQTDASLEMGVIKQFSNSGSDSDFPKRF